MKKNGAKYIKILIFLSIFITIISGTVLAAGWWGQPAYEWAIRNNLTSMANNSSLNNAVSLDSLYSIILKYIKMHNIQPKSNVVQNVGSINSFNKALNGIVANIDSYISKTSLTADEYRIVDTYIVHVDRTIEEQKSLLTRDNIKNIHLYMDIARYKAATLISDYSYRTYVLSRLKPIKYAELVRYNINPYFGSITRGEFFALIFSLRSDSTSMTKDAIINELYDSGIIEGYYEDTKVLELNKDITYIEVFQYLMKLDNLYDFDRTDDEKNGEEIVEIR